MNPRLEPPRPVTPSDIVDHLNARIQSADRDGSAANNPIAGSPKAVMPAGQHSRLLVRIEPFDSDPCVLRESERLAGWKGMHVAAIHCEYVVGRGGAIPIALR
jgi:hypothetical protein